MDDEDGEEEEHITRINGIPNLNQRSRHEVEEVREGAERVLNRSQYQQEYIVLPAPQIGQQPVVETTPGYIIETFPSLFPDGAGDFHQPRIRKVELGEYFTHLMRFRDGRFARHQLFPWFAFNTLQRQRTFAQSKIFVRQNHDAGRMTAMELRDLLEEGDERIAHNMIRYGAKLRGTRAYWSQRRYELMDMIRVIGTPHLFFTFSAADLQWPDLHQHMPSELDIPPEDERGRKQQRRLALERNPHIAATYLDKRFQIFFKYVLAPTLGIKHFWYRYEWQERGSGHIHGLCWLKDAPNPDEINWSCLKDPAYVPTAEQAEKMSQFSSYWAKIITAKNPFPREDLNAPLLGPHPCGKSRQMCENTKQELTDLLNWVQRHANCVAGYCQIKRKVPGQTEPQTICRFDFPMPCCDGAGISLDSKRRPRFEAD